MELCEAERFNYRNKCIGFVLIYLFCKNLSLMKLPKYTVETNKDNLVYEFYSEGPKGKIKKVIQYGRFDNTDQNLFNLGFGDWIETEQRVDDKVTSNNNDREKVLSTVAATAIEFTDHYPGAKIFIVGSTSSRTRLYQIGIAAFLNEIEELFIIEGLIERKWEFFVKGRPYEAFLLSRK